MSIKVIYNHHAFAVSTFAFSGGELQVEIPDLPKLDNDVVVVTRLQDPDAIMELLMVTEIIDRRSVRNIRKSLVIPYFPYARQDRIMSHNQAFSLKPFAKFINSLGYDKVTVCDPHSDVTAALINNVEVYSQFDCIIEHMALGMFLNDKKPVIIAPDVGATKKAEKVASFYDLELITASKMRDIKTGVITNTAISEIPPGDKPALIIDDICDGGGTFTHLAKVLKEAGSPSVSLYVTHGIFSKGLEVFDGLIDNIFTTSTFYTHYRADNLFIAHLQGK